MSFDSYYYFILLVLSLICFIFLSGPTLRKIFLILVSLYFYSYYHYFYGSLIILIIIFNFYLSKNIKNNGFYLCLGVFVNILNLCLFKYFNFYIDYLNWSFDALILPIGVSFYTFQSISYLYDVYKGKINNEKNIINFSIFILFFPQLIAGPIEKYKRMTIQYSCNLKFKLENFHPAIFRILIGVFKKVVLVNNIAIFTDEFFASPELFPSYYALIMIYIFSLQIYYDFSAYCDIAIGSAKLFGVNLSENFNKPYLSTSVSDFWRRWHITLSSWIKEYVYIPLGGNKKGEARTITNLIISMVLSGIWHGNSLIFVIWGFLHGILLVMERFFSKITNIKNKYVKMFFTFNIISFLWVFFRCENLSDSYLILKSIYSGFIGVDFIFYLLIVFILSFFCIFINFVNKKDIFQLINNQGFILRVIFYLFFLFFIYVFYGENDNLFIYFAF